MDGNTYKFKVGDRNIYVTINRDIEDCIAEVFINVGRPTDDERIAADIVGRLISLSLAFGAPVEEVVQHLCGHTGGTEALTRGLGYFGTIWEPVARALAGETGSAIDAWPTQRSACPNCELDVVVKKDNHWTCRTCGWKSG